MMPMAFNHMTVPTLLAQNVLGLTAASAMQIAPQQTKATANLAAGNINRIHSLASYGQSRVRGMISTPLTTGSRFLSHVRRAHSLGGKQ
jgi:hypothetical protein